MNLKLRKRYIFSDKLMALVWISLNTVLLMSILTH